MKKNLLLKDFLICLIIALFFCIPILKGSFRAGPDTTFHINRIIALANAIKNNDYFPKIFFEQNYNFGYGSPLFYSYIFLYPSAFLSLMGFSPFLVYVFTIFMIAFLSAFNMYSCAKRFYKNPNNIYLYLTVFIYVVNLFFLSNIYKRGAIGEGLAYIFLPVVIKGIYEVLYLKRNKWYYLVYGFCGLMLSHNITFILMVVIFFILLLFEYKKLNFKIIINLTLATFISLLITGFFSLMMFEQLALKLYRINGYFNTESMKGIDLIGLFSFSNGEKVYLNNTIGPFLFFLPLLVFLTKKTLLKKFMLFLTLSSYVMIFMTTKYFPWSWFKFMSFLQFPERLLTIVCAFMALSSGYGLSRLKFKNNKIKPSIFIVILLVSILHIGGIFSEYGTINAAMSNADLKEMSIFHEENYWYNLLEVSSPDYIYKNSEIDFKNYGYIIKTNNEENDRTGFDRSKYNQLVFTIGKVNKDAFYILPISYYKGYEINLYEDDTFIKTIQPYHDEETGLVRFNLDEYNGDKLLKIVCTYKKTDLQNLGEMISKIGLALFFVCRLLTFLKSKINKRVITAVDKKYQTYC